MVLSGTVLLLGGVFIIIVRRNYIYRCDVCPDQPLSCNHRRHIFLECCPDTIASFEGQAARHDDATSKSVIIPVASAHNDRPRLVPWTIYLVLVFL